MPPNCVIDIMFEIVDPCGKNDLSRLDDQNKINRYLSGIKVNYEIPSQPSTKRTYRINGLGPTANSYKFEVNGKMLSIKEYFFLHKNYKLIYPNLPCLWVGNKNENTYLPAEVRKPSYICCNQRNKINSKFVL